MVRIKLWLADFITKLTLMNLSHIFHWSLKIISWGPGAPKAPIRAFTLLVGSNECTRGFIFMIQGLLEWIRYIYEKGWMQV